MNNSSENSPHTRAQKPPKTVFFAAVVALFFLTLSAADSIGLVPSYLDGTHVSDVVALSNVAEAESVPSVSAEAVFEKPERIVISAIGLDLAVQNPLTREIAALDELLKDGPARYVDSALLGENGNMIIFAHSSHLPIVRNQMYKAFNRIPELQAGDTITLYAGNTAYLYSVQSVTKADATDTRIDMSPEKGARLTLVTCDTLTSKNSRFVLEAEFMGSYTI